MRPPFRKIKVNPYPGTNPELWQQGYKMLSILCWFIAAAFFIGVGGAIAIHFWMK